MLADTGCSVMAFGPNTRGTVLKEAQRGGLTYYEALKLLSLPYRKVKYRYPVIIKGILNTLSQKGIKRTGDII